MNRVFASLSLGVGCGLVLVMAQPTCPAAQAVTNTPAALAAGLMEPGRILSLAEARRISFEQNWDLLAVRAGVNLATAQLMVAKEFPNPTFSFSTARIDPHGNGTPLGNGLWARSYDSIFAIGQLVEIGGKRRDRQLAGQAGLLSARARFLDARRALEQGVTKAYVNALLAGENARVLDESARSLRREAEIAETRFKAGDISDADRQQIQNNADVFQLQASAAETSATQARISVEILLGVSEPKGLWTPRDSLAQLAGLDLEGDSVARPGLRPDVLAAESDLRKAQADLALQKAQRIPDPTFQSFYEHNPPGPPGPDTLGLGVSFPLPLWNRNRGNIKAAEATREQLALALAKLTAQARADISVAELAYREAYARRQRYADQILPRSAKVREAVAFAYEKGSASLVDLLTAERDDNNVRLAAAQASADAANAAADLKAARASVSETELKELK
jgi:outer membrane protein, heavy metal efflux system